MPCCATGDWRRREEASRSTERQGGGRARPAVPGGGTGGVHDCGRVGIPLPAAGSGVARHRFVVHPQPADDHAVATILTTAHRPEAADS